MNDELQRTLRLPRALNERIEAVAKQSGRSVNAEIRVRLEASLTNASPAAPVPAAALTAPQREEVKNLISESLAQASPVESAQIARDEDELLQAYRHLGGFWKRLVRRLVAVLQTDSARPRHEVLERLASWLGYLAWSTSERSDWLFDKPRKEDHSSST